MIRMSYVAAACALVLCAANAQAASSSSASISGITFTLIDLNPNDGIDPSFSFQTSKGTTTFSLSATDNAVGESDSSSRTRPGTFSFTNDQLSQLTNVAASGTLTNQSLSVSGSAYGPQTSYNTSASTGVNNGNYYGAPLNLTLSANSVLLIDAEVNLAASASNPPTCSYYYYCNTSETAQASATSTLTYTYTGSSISSTYNSPQTLSLQANATGGYSTQQYQYDPVSGNYIWVTTTTPYTEESKNLNDVLHSVFSNSTAITQSASLGFAVAATGSATTPFADPILTTDFTTLAAVPEPSTYLLFAQGLALGGFLLRRRRQA